MIAAGPAVNIVLAFLILFFVASTTLNAQQMNQKVWRSRLPAHRDLRPEKGTGSCRRRQLICGDWTRRNALERFGEDVAAHECAR